MVSCYIKMCVISRLLLLRASPARLLPASAPAQAVLSAVVWPLLPGHTGMLCPAVLSGNINAGCELIQEQSGVAG